MNKQESSHCWTGGCHVVGKNIITNIVIQNLQNTGQSPETVKRITRKKKDHSSQKNEKANRFLSRSVLDATNTAVKPASMSESEWSRHLFFSDPESNYFRHAFQLWFHPPQAFKATHFYKNDSWKGHSVQKICCDGLSSWFIVLNQFVLFSKTSSRKVCEIALRRNTYIFRRHFPAPITPCLPFLWNAGSSLLLDMDSMSSWRDFKKRCMDHSREARRPRTQFIRA